VYKEIIQKIITFQSRGLLSFVSFIESIFFPIPTDVLLIPMCYSKPSEWKILALITTVASVIGGVVGFFLGSFLFMEVYPIIEDLNYVSEFNDVKNLFYLHGALIILIASFTPLPYKLFTITAGFLSVDFILFLVFSLIGRALRFYLVAYITKAHGVVILEYLNRYFLYIASVIIIVYIIINLYN
tara:strand:+ start:1668 stop:2222 length:555 start_codon:yes stop_codon:yes gene_type:complete